MASLNNPNQAHSLQDAIPGPTNFSDPPHAFWKVGESGDEVWDFSADQDVGESIFLNVPV